MDTWNYRDRVRAGRHGETLILRSLVRLGFSIRAPTLYEDMHQKIDGYISNPTTGIMSEEAMQVKYRQTGTDILMETCFLSRRDGCPIPHAEIRMNGRDVVGTALIFICLSNDRRTIRFCWSNTLKKHAVHMTQKLLDLRKQDLSKRVLNDEKGCGQVRITRDKSSHREKIVFFAKPEKFVFWQHTLGEPIVL